MAWQIESIKKALRSLFEAFFPAIVKAYKSIVRDKKGIPQRYLWGDLLSVLRSIGIFMVFNIIAICVFTILPAGKDALLIVIEDVGVHYSCGSLLSLMLGVTCWALVSEFGVRYSIYVTDNSAKTLSEERVKWRKTLQQIVAGMFIVLPFTIVAVGLLINYFQQTGFTPAQRDIGFGVTALLLYGVLRGLIAIYFKPFSHVLRPRHKNYFSYFWTLPLHEKRWGGKLYGIYNDYAFTLPKPINFHKQTKKKYKFFGNVFLKVPWIMWAFPQSRRHMHSRHIVPQQFKLRKFSGEGNPHDNFYRWIYHVPLGFYRGLHRRLRMVGIFSFVSLFTIAFMPSTGFYQWMGAPGLVCFAFACWSGVYLGILYVDYALLRNKPVTVRFILLVLLIVCSVFNNDHPVRKVEYPSLLKRETLSQHFVKWLNDYKRGNDHYYTLKESLPDSNTDINSWLTDCIQTCDTSIFQPVVFVCAEGGALRTGGYAGLLLAHLQDSLADLGIDFKKSVYAMSGVSGGGLGISFFNAMNYLNKPGDLQDKDELSLTKRFFYEDFLSPVLGKMFYGDLINLFIPWYVPSFDRAIALEKAWEHGYNNILAKNGANVFSSDFKTLYTDTVSRPALFINTTEIETGLQCWVTNVDPGGLLFSDERDLFRRKITGSVSYSTAINFSSRFPLFSPAGMLSPDYNRKFHYVDGGYVENTGAGTMLEVLKEINRDNLFRKELIKPIVIVIRFRDESKDAFTNVNFGNELREIISGIYNTRSGRTRTAEAHLEEYIRSLNGEYIPVSLSKNGREVPMNWTLSQQSLNNIEADIRDKCSSMKDCLLTKLLFADTVIYENVKHKWPKPNPIKRCCKVLSNSLCPPIN